MPKWRSAGGAAKELTYFSGKPFFSLDKIPFITDIRRLRL